MTATIRFIAGWLVLLGLTLGAPPTAPAQSFLDRLEQRLQQIVPTTPEDEEALPPDVGRPGYLGLVGDEIPNGGGVRVESVRRGGPAERAGLQAGDRIVGLNGTEVRNLDDMARGLDRQWVRSRLEIRYEREGEIRQARVILGERPNELSARSEGRPSTVSGPSLSAPGDPRSTARPLPAPPSPPSDLFLPPPAPPVFGASLGEVTTTLQRRYGLTASAGAIILDIEPSTPAESSRLLRGALITEINGRPIQHPDDVLDLLDNAAPGDSWKLNYFVRQQSYETTLELGASRVVEDDSEEAPPLARADDDPVPLPLPAPPVESDSRSPTTSQPSADGALDLARRLGRDGQRPLLGRIGQVVDDVTGGARTPRAAPPVERPLPAPTAPPPPPRAVEEPRPSGELQRLQVEVQELRAEIERLRRRLEGLEERIVPRDP